MTSATHECQVSVWQLAIKTGDLLDLHVIMIALSATGATGVLRLVVALILKSSAHIVSAVPAKMGPRSDPGMLYLLLDNTHGYVASGSPQLANHWVEFVSADTVYGMVFFQDLNSS